IKDMDFEEFSEKEFNENLKKTKELLDESSADDFYKSVGYVEHFQVQKDLEELSKYKKNINEPNENIVENIRNALGVELLNSISQQREGLFAWDVPSLIRNLEKATKEISDGIEPIWFRGHGSYKYRLLPSLYRMKDEKMYFYKGISLRDIMEPLFKSFKVRAFGAKEIFEGGDNSRIGILVSMQHYSVPTNILDWTPSAFTAIYFAVENYMAISEKEKRERKEAEEDAEVWLLNPIRLNQARAFLTSRKMDSGTMWEYPIPSVYENEEEYKEYIPFSTKKESLNVPVAVYVPHINQRIKAQLGTFTMFSLDSQGEVSEDGKSVKFEDLLDIQERYRDRAKGDEYKPFLISVRISKNCLLEVADWLRIMGVSKPNVYPELSNISKSLTGEIRDYWEKNEVK
ncbi:MAG: FRG domain-containing protein, partial [Ruminococcus sp.]|nr:FRG domain-containing protein [Ruminococcus sp.]